MKMTRFSDIGLRVLMYLAQQDRSPPATVSEVAAQFDVPHNHMVKVAGALAKIGWIEALRGRNGGIRLAVSPSLLLIGEVLRTLEGDTEVIDCEGIGCRLSHDCRLRDALKVGLNAFYTAMNQYAVSDMVTGQTGEQISVMHRTFLGARIG
jgi:Rrf2 family transcriptional regulator, nitric oxide-sensitive transcriptional repressor